MLNSLAHTEISKSMDCGMHYNIILLTFDFQGRRSKYTIYWSATHLLGVGEAKYWGAYSDRCALLQY